MALAAAVQGARRTAQLITWLDEDGDPLDISGAVLTARLRRVATGDVATADGLLTVTDGPAGQFSWQYGAADVAAAGDFEVQFTATANGLSDRTFLESWEVVEAL